MKSKPEWLVAVVDDDATILEAIADLMASAGYLAVTFDSAGAMLEIADLGVIGCLISDIRMPGMDGWELASRVRAAKPGMPLVFMTAHDAVECDAGSQLRRHSPARLLRKPFDPQELISAVRDALKTTSSGPA